MIKANVTVENIEGFDAQIAEVVKAIDHNIKAVALEVRNEAKATSAFTDRSGRLRRSISVRESKFDEGGYIVQAKAPHAHLVEFGHALVAWGNETGKRVQPRPFMRPALEKGIMKAVEVFRGTR